MHRQLKKKDVPLSLKLRLPSRDTHSPNLTYLLIVVKNPDLGKMTGKVMRGLHGGH